jgi:ubiquinone/menaquinone biosynthesis C-methylase UbiE
MAVLLDNTSPYRPIESWIYDRVIAPAVLELATPVDKLVLDIFRNRAKILEVGCGGGHLAEHIAQRRSDVSLCGVDLSPEQIRRSEKRCRAWRNRLTFVQGTVSDLKFPDGGFDAVISVASVKHWPDKIQGLRECVRVLSPKGVLNIVEADRGCHLDDARVFVDRWRIAGVFRSIALFWFRTCVAGQGIDLDEARTMLEALDLSEQRVERIPGTPGLLMFGRK